MATTKRKKQYAKKGMGCTKLPDGSAFARGKVPTPTELNGLVDLDGLTKPLIVIFSALAVGFAGYKGYQWWKDHKKDTATADLQNNLAAQKALAFYNALHTTWGTEDEEEVIRIAGTLKPGEYAEVQKIYTQVYNTNLATTINDLLTPAQLQRFNANLQKSNRNPVEVWQGTWTEIYAANIGKTLYNRYPSPGNNTPLSLYSVVNGVYKKGTTLSLKNAGNIIGVMTAKNFATPNGVTLNFAKVRLAKIPGFESYAGKEYYIYTGYLMTTPAPALKGLGCASCGGKCAMAKTLGCSSCSAMMPIMQSNQELGSVQIA